jgi:segregation and condensation protein B
MDLKAQIESLLLVSLKPLSAKDLLTVIGAKIKDVEEALADLEREYRQAGRGLVIVKNGNYYQLATHPDNSDLVKTFLKEETAGELSQPSLEALTIIAYRGPIAKPELEKIRGVNCSLIIRNLLLRGLIEEKMDRQKGENYYSVTNDFIRFLGISRLEDLPDYNKLTRLQTISRILEEAAPDIV